MEISSRSTAAFLARAQATQPQEQVRVQPASAVNDGPDRENDGDADDRGAVTATRGQNVNILA